MLPRRRMKRTHLFKTSISLLLALIVNLGIAAAFGILLSLNSLA